MHLLTSLILLPMVVLVSCNEEENAEKDPYAIEDLGSKEAVDAMTTIRKNYDDLKDKLEEFADKLASDNDLLTSVHSFRSTYESVKGTKCAGQEAPDDSDKDLSMSFIDDCEEAMPSDDIGAYKKKLLWFMAKVKEIDDNLKKNEETCGDNPSACEKTKKSELKNLNKVFTSKDKDHLNKDAKEIFTKFSKDLRVCFKRETKDLKESLDKGVKTMKKCLAEKS